MTYLLDTNSCIRLLNENQNSPVARKLVTLQPTDIRLCTIVEAELYFGAYRSSRRESNLARLEQFCRQFTSLPFDHQAAVTYGQIRSELSTLGTPIGPNDYLIAAIALAHDLTLVTHNIREFSRVEGLALEDWETE